MPMHRALALLLLAGFGFADLHAQDAKETEKKLQQLRGELKSVAAERRKIEGQRGDASRQLRQADEQVGRSSRSLAETEALLKRERKALDELQQQRDALQARLAAQRRQMAALLRAAYLQGGNAPLKALLSQDSVARANLALTYQGYVQRDRARQVGQLNQELEQLAQLQAQVDERHAQLEQARQQQHAQVSQLEKDRRQRATLVTELDKQYRSRAEREKALGQDAKALERLLANLRAAARRAEQERKRQQQAAAAASSSGTAKKTPPKVTASAPPLRVGGAGWPVSGNLLARYGGRMPDGRNSSGLLIGAAAGSPVTAVADGTVVFAEWMTGYGLILIVDHGNGYMSLYAHNESLLHDAGDAVKRGEAVAKVGSSGGFGTPALYFELRRDGQPVDPAAWLQKR